MATIKTYNDLIKQIQKGQYVAGAALRKAAKPLVIYKLELDEEMRLHLNHLIQELSAGPQTGTAKTRLENFKAIGSGKAVNWNAMDKATKALGIDKSVDHLGHKDISNLRIHAAEIEKHWPRSKRPADFDNVMRKYQALIQLLDNLDDRLTTQLGDFAGSNERLEKFLTLLNSPTTVDIGATAEQALVSGEAQNLITISIEDALENTIKGGVSHALGFLIKDYLTGSKSAQDKLRKVLDSVDIDIHGSPRLMDDIGDIVEGVFFGKEPKRLRRKKKYLKRGKSKPAGIRRKKPTPINTRPIRGRDRIPDLGVSIHVLLNEVLPAYVKDQMGSPEDPPIKLRNQTGRFAEAVEVVGVTSTRSGAVNVLYSIMQDPYGTFLPGGRLYTPERDPSALIPVAIREAATSLIGRRLRLNTELVR